MDRTIRRQLDLLEFSFNAANSSNHAYLASEVQMRVEALGNFCGLDTLAAAAVEELEGHAAHFVAALAAPGKHLLRQDAIRADTLAALSRLRQLLETDQMIACPEATLTPPPSLAKPTSAQGSPAQSSAILGSG